MGSYAGFRVKAFCFGTADALAKFGLGYTGLDADSACTLFGWLESSWFGRFVDLFVLVIPFRNGAISWCELEGKKIWRGRDGKGYGITSHSIVLRKDLNTVLVYLTRKAEFAASHYYHNPDLSPEENQRLFGKCNN